MRAPDLRSSSLRLRVVRLLLLLCFVVLAARAAQLAALDPRPARRAEEQIFAAMHINAERGRILDRHGAELALTINAPSVYALPALISDKRAAAQKLAGVLPGSAANLAQRLARSDGFTFLARWVKPEVAERALALGLPGVGVLEEPRRAYPYATLAASVIGFSNIDGVGVRGIEQQEDPWLRGERRRVTVERDARGRFLALPGYDPRGSAGGDVRLALDAVFQADAEAALEQALAETRARGGSVLAMDVHSGAILALAEAPSFDPNQFRTLHFRTTRARAFEDAVEPGSVLKIFLVAGALERAAVSPTDLLDCRPGSFSVPGKLVRDHHPQGILDVGGVLRVSSNIGAARIAYALGAPAYYETLVDFGFGRPTGSGFPNESSGLLRSWRQWRPVDHATMAFGQGISVTPVQLAAATAVLANGGIWNPPQLVAARRHGETWVATKRAAGRRVLSEHTARRVLRMMEEVVTPDGTARRAALRDVRVAGKTGTAQKLDPATRRYSDRYLAWFVGVVPADDPQLVVVAQLDEPKSAHTGGAVAAPLFAEAVQGELARRGILTEPEFPVRPPTFTLVRTENTTAIEKSALPIGLEAASSVLPDLAQLGDSVLLPDLRGLTVNQVKALAARAPFHVEVFGDGRAIAQEPDAGSVLTRGSGRVRVQFGPRAGKS